jgi:RHH-type proline utilization regulon transcriptional repressor/proline dehydrogenase/delta 1-pyrroline-5-carboxylate dehydrogenase
VRIYAPVGSHKELLAYLVRRLLENGANSASSTALPMNRFRSTIWSGSGRRARRN